MFIYCLIKYNWMSCIYMARGGCYKASYTVAKTGDTAQYCAKGVTQ